MILQLAGWIPSVAVWLIMLAMLVLVLSYGLYERYQRKRLYHDVDWMLNRILEGQEITEITLKENEISALLWKAARIQEKTEHDIRLARLEKEQVKRLIADMSHQLKTPLANLMMYREMLEQEGNSREQSELFLQKIKQQSEKIDWILQSLFKEAKLEQGAIQFEISESSLKETLLLAVNAVYEKAEAKEIEIVTEPFDDVRVLHNSKWTAEVFVNLLENAIKYTDGGGTIKICIFPMELFTRIQIKDTGIGIHEEEQTAVFQRFYRSRDVEEKEGSGIGLYLSRLILEKENGYITVNSEYGRGSCFSVFLQNGRH